jgi:branched-subunit amino acid transport protein
MGATIAGDAYGGDRMSRAWEAVLLAAAGTFAMRAAFLVAAHRLAEVPAPVQRVLRQIPPAALAAIVAPALLRPHGHLDVWQPELAAGVTAALAFWRTRSTALTLVVGMVVLIGLQHL